MNEKYEKSTKSTLALIAAGAISIITAYNAFTYLFTAAPEWRDKAIETYERINEKLEYTDQETADRLAIQGARQELEEVIKSTGQKQKRALSINPTRVNVFDELVGED